MNAQCYTAASTEDDPATPDDEAALACDASELCVTYRDCDIAAAAEGYDIAAACQAPADACFNSQACLGALNTEDDPSTPDDETQVACDADALCSTFVECQLQSEVPADPTCATQEGACFADDACLAALNTEDDPATPIDEFVGACSLSSLCTAFMDCQFQLQLPEMIEAVSAMCPAEWANCEAVAPCAAEFETAIQQPEPPTDGSAELLSLVECLVLQSGEGEICMDPTGDGIIGTADLLVVLALFGRTCEAATGVVMCP
jgi:hypothetical protein|eukprot:COSAG02_NODE_156_length_33065_cov_17.208336_2_plen_261_part_00